MNKKLIKRMVFVTVTILLLIAVTVAVVAEYVSRGKYKDVITGGEYYFESNILKEGEGNSFTCYSSNQTITILNSNSEGNFNMVDVIYNITFEVPEYENSGVTYSISDGENTYPLTTELVTYEDKLLASGSRVINEYYLTVSGTGTPQPVRIVATPTEPLHMQNDILSTTVFFASSSFTVSGRFDISGNDISKYAGFIYRLTTTGTPEAEDRITVTWDKTQLSLGENNILPDGVAVVDSDDEIHSYITLSPEADIQSLTFFRVPFDSETSNGFAATTVAGLNALVAVENTVQS